MNDEAVGQAVIDAVWDTLKDLYLEEKSPFDDTAAEALCLAVAQGVVAGLREYEKSRAGASAAAADTAAPDPAEGDWMIDPPNRD